MLNIYHFKESKREINLHATNLTLFISTTDTVCPQVNHILSHNKIQESKWDSWSASICVRKHLSKYFCIAQKESAHLLLVIPKIIKAVQYLTVLLLFLLLLRKTQVFTKLNEPMLPNEYIPDSLYQFSVISWSSLISLVSNLYEVSDSNLASCYSCQYNAKLGTRYLYELFTVLVCFKYPRINHTVSKPAKLLHKSKIQPLYDVRETQ